MDAKRQKNSLPFIGDDLNIQNRMFFINTLALTLNYITEQNIILNIYILYSTDFVS